MSDTTQEKSDQINDSRRKFFKIGLAGAGVAAAAAGGALTLNAMEGKEHDDLYVPVDEKLFKPFDQRHSVLSYVMSGVDKELLELGMGFEKQPYRNEPGYTQLDRALAEGGWAVQLGVAGRVAVRLFFEAHGQLEQLLIYAAGGIGQHGIALVKRLEELFVDGNI